MEFEMLLYMEINYTNSWLSFCTSNSTNDSARNLCTWCRCYCWAGMLFLGKIDEEKNCFI